MRERRVCAGVECLQGRRAGGGRRLMAIVPRGRRRHPWAAARVGSTALPSAFAAYKNSTETDPMAGTTNKEDTNDVTFI